MLIDFREISPGGLDVESVETIHWVTTGKDDPLRRLYRFPKPFNVKAHLEKTNETVQLSGHYSGEVQTQCVRCLAAVDTRVDADFKLILLPHAAAEAADEERELESDDLDTAFYDEAQVELGDIVSEQIILTLDLYPRCREDCKGLCPECGANLNELSCRCAEEQVDSRWQALKGFKAE